MDTQSKIYSLLLTKALSLISKRRYTVLGLKKKLILHLEKKLKSDPASLQLPGGVGLETASPDLSELAGRTPSSKDFEPDLKQVLSRLKELKYLDDTAYTKDFIESRISSRPRGKFLLKRDLKNKGIHPDLAARIVEESEINEEEIAFEALLKKFKRYSQQLSETCDQIDDQNHIQPHAQDDLRKQKEKALRFLASRGFKIDAIYKAVDRWYNRHS